MKSHQFCIENTSDLAFPTVWLGSLFCLKPVGVAGLWEWAVDDLLMWESWKHHSLWVKTPPRKASLPFSLFLTVSSCFPFLHSDPSTLTWPVCPLRMSVFWPRGREQELAECSNLYCTTSSQGSGSFEEEEADFKSKGSKWIQRYNVLYIQQGTWTRSSYNNSHRPCASLSQSKFQQGEGRWTWRLLLSQGAITLPSPNDRWERGKGNLCRQSL